MAGTLEVKQLGCHYGGLRHAGKWLPRELVTG